MRTFYLLTRFDIFATSLKELFMIFVDRVVRKDGAVDNLLPRFKEQKYLILSVTRFLPSLV
ncbi:hypothetical protein LEP1GSC058_4022 [Leptospira fainei serovar Hurstbridge str. BUT 6]|uniref:Uncharacterized protein n=1 Tax=Leptospira fainei serovar Hurstbridge str. BUT 6 TaxID=1193011 RepID=S3VYW1_9LEPT|nr:hypothetical protein [Leptospira fainei]EPG73292.1 hypothetical protein LEP1GSC058_4022 [Leptospira fainei serovar Hurstbridge str. BUT 6]